PGVQGGLWPPIKNQRDPITGWKPVPLIAPRLGGSSRSALLIRKEGMFLGEVGGFQDYLLPQAGARVDEDGAHQIGGGFGRPSRRDGQGDENLWFFGGLGFQFLQGRMEAAQLKGCPQPGGFGHQQGQLRVLQALQEEERSGVRRGQQGVAVKFRKSQKSLAEEDYPVFRNLNGP